MNNEYEFVYDNKTNLVDLKKFVSGCGSINSHTETVAYFTLREALALKLELEDCIRSMKAREGEIKEETRKKLIKEKEELLLRVAEVQTKLDKGDY